MRAKPAAPPSARSAPTSSSEISVPAARRPAPMMRAASRAERQHQHVPFAIEDRLDLASSAIGHQAAVKLTGPADSSAIS